ncbi:MAG: BBP7 family outer membrane beta-barrel protein [Pirellulaceae bacterium]|nr:BBP7 family outer membrane beta-barrel protein [Pirellulaceae bacterium]
MLRTATIILAAAGFAGFAGLATSAAGSEFSERLAAWQGRPSGAPVERASYQAPVAAAPMPASPAPTAYAPHATPWHDMAFGGYHGYDHYGPGIAGDCCGSCDSCGDGCGACRPSSLWWVRSEVLIWWQQGRDLPPLVTSDPVTEDSDTAGILPGADILFGGERTAGTMTPGGRLDIGTFLDPGQCWGIGNRFWGTGRDSSGLQISDVDNPVLAIPFFNVAQNQNDALLVAYPGLRSGSIDVRNSANIYGNDVYARILFCRGPCGRIDLITGYNFTRMNDELQLRSVSTFTQASGSIPQGTTLNTYDRFATRNVFHGGILGLSGTYDSGCCWTVNGLARISVGNVGQRAVVRGSRILSVPGQNSTTDSSGLFADDTNSGTFDRNDWTAISELGINLGYKIAPCTQVTIGYSLIYWNDVVRAADQVDTRIGTNTATGEISPQFHFNRSDFWVQGLNLGLTCEF